jgi:hypothetical protein
VRVLSANRRLTLARRRTYTLPGAQAQPLTGEFQESRRQKQSSDLQSPVSETWKQVIKRKRKSRRSIGE